MKLILSIAFIGLSLTSVSALANCRSELVATCGDFQVISTACPKYNHNGKFMGFTDSLVASYQDAPAGEIKLEKVIDSVQDVETYKGNVNSNSNIYLEVTSEFGQNGQRQDTYLTYSIGWGIKSAVKHCEKGE